MWEDRESQHDGWWQGYGRKKRQETHHEFWEQQPFSTKSKTEVKSIDYMPYFKRILQKSICRMVNIFDIKYQQNYNEYH